MMNKNLLGIFLVLLLILPTLTITANEESRHIQQITYRNSIIKKCEVPSRKWLDGSDQMQINTTNYIAYQEPGRELAQAFIPTKDTLTAVALYYTRFGQPHEQTTLTISIREELEGENLTTITILAKEYKIKNYPPYTWVLFDFPDITVVPGQTYYIHETISRGDMWNDNYGWIFGINTPYVKGDAWVKDYGFDWFIIGENEWGTPTQFPNPDFCFITYHEEPKIKAPLHPFFSFLDQHPYLFPLLRIILNIN